MSRHPVSPESPGGSHRGRLTRSLCVSVIIAAALVVSIVTLALAVTADFPDVSAAHPYYQAINDLASKGVVGGYIDGNFGPNDLVKRQQFAKMAVLAGGYPVSEADVCAFSDVDKSDGSTYFPDNFIAVCASKGITTGKTATTFDPYKEITRLQVISMVVRMADDLQPGLLGWLPGGLAGERRLGVGPYSRDQRAQGCAQRAAGGTRLGLSQPIGLHDPRGGGSGAVQLAQQAQWHQHVRFRVHHDYRGTDYHDNRIAQHLD